MDTGLADKIVLVTGASGGIGGAVVRQFAAEGAQVAIHYNQGEDRALALQTELPEAASTLVVQADLTRESAVAEMHWQIESAWNAPADILVANAGYWPSDHQPLAEMSLDRWRHTLDVNLTAVFLGCRQFLRRCQEHQRVDPAIVMIGSTAGLFGEADHADYAAAKSGLMGGLLNSLKNEIPRLAPRGRINAVCPGWTMTPMARKFQDNPEAMLLAAQTIPLRKFGTPEDIAKAVVFLASNTCAGHITGQSLVVSGGMEGRVLNSLDELNIDAL